MLVSTTAQPRKVLPEHVLTILVSKILAGRAWAAASTPQTLRVDRPGDGGYGP